MPGSQSAAADPRHKPIIKLTDITIAYGEDADAVTAVEGFDLSEAEGQFLCLLGPSGCGKSTVLKSMSGITRESTVRNPHRSTGEGITARHHLHCDDQRRPAFGSVCRRGPGQPVSRSNNSILYFLNIGAMFSV